MIDLMFVVGDAVAAVRETPSMHRAYDAAAFGQVIEITKRGYAKVLFEDGTSATYKNDRYRGTEKIGDAQAYRPWKLIAAKTAREQIAHYEERNAQAQKNAAALVDVEHVAGLAKRVLSLRGHKPTDAAKTELLAELAKLAATIEQL